MCNVAIKKYGNYKCKYRPNIQLKVIHVYSLATSNLTLLWWSIRRNLSLTHHMVSLIYLTHHSHWWLLSLIMLPTSLGHVVLLGRRLLVHHRAYHKENHSYKIGIWSANFYNYWSFTKKLGALLNKIFKISATSKKGRFRSNLQNVLLINGDNEGVA